MPSNNPYGGDITQHEEYAITGKANQNEDFGVQKHNHKNRPHADPMQGRRAALNDGKRGIPKHNGYHPLPNHGPFEFDEK